MQIKKNNSQKTYFIGCFWLIWYSTKTDGKDEPDWYDVRFIKNVSGYKLLSDSKKQQ